MPASALSCPRCQREPLEVGADGGGTAFCRHCHVTFERMVFPALTAPRQAVRPQAVVAEDAVCFFHAENQAEAVCGGCGRYLCAVCAIDAKGTKLCPACFATRTSADTGIEKDRVLHDTRALTFALLPFVFWPATFITAPLTIIFIFRDWRKPLGIGRDSRWRFVVAGLVAVPTILGWALVLLGVSLFTSHPVTIPPPKP